MQTQIFPPKEVAMELKRVGFNEPCIGWYSSNLHDLKSIKPHLEGEFTFNSEFLSQSANSCTAPTYDQVIGWFAEVHGIEINTTANHEITEYSTDVWQKDEGLPKHEGVWYPNRQQSLLTAFREAIKLIEK